MTALVDLPPSHPRRKPELMSPAGGMAQLQAAVEAGADAVYFGLSGFNARAKALAFDHENLAEVLAWLHRRGVMGFVAVNTLAFENELATLERELLALAAAQADAIIVQDLGVMRLAQALVPDLPLHASTQMTVTSAEGAAFARRLGASRVVLARELSLKDMAQVRAATQRPGHEIELEVFVHGALCVSYSGQCFSSEAWGGRSANRGQCAQACRLPYQLLVDGNQRDLGPYRYLLSPHDLYALEQIPALIATGIDCFKIEGRYKDAEYVAAATSAYRGAIDAAWQQEEFAASEEKLRLENAYSRGLVPAFVSGTNHQLAVEGRAPRHRGMLAGQVLWVGERGVGIELTQAAQSGRWALKPGDGLVFDAADWRDPAEPEEGGPLYEVLIGGYKHGSSAGFALAELRFGNKQLKLWRIREGDLVWRTHDPQLTKELRPYLEAGDPLYRRPLSWTVAGEVGQPLLLSAHDDQGNSASALSDSLLQIASRRSLDDVTLRQELDKLGETPFYLDQIDNQLHGQLFLPLSVLSKTRRQALEALLEAKSKRRIGAGAEPVVAKANVNVNVKANIKADADRFSQPVTALTGATATNPYLSLLIRQADQLEAAIATRPDEIILDYLELYGLRPSVEQIQEAGIRAVVASPRILKPQEERISRFLLSLATDAILVRSIGLLDTLLAAPEHPQLYGDFSLNAVNSLAANELLGLGLARLAPGHDLNAQQLSELAAALDPRQLEIILHHHLPIFHTEHCVFCRFLTDGTDYTNCGHPCEQHKLALRDERGFEHPVLADVGCRNTVFEARAQTGASFLAHWRKAGFGHYRLEFVHETPAEISQTVKLYRQAFSNEITSAVLERELDQIMPQGTTKGSFMVPEGMKLLPLV
jgi:U32 family peptidase